jgi:hypothetical protein
MEKTKHTTALDPTNFDEVHNRFKKSVEALYDEDKSAANKAYEILAIKTYKYGNALANREAVDQLVTYLARRDRSTSVFSMGPYQLALELMMPGKYPPLHASLRRKLGMNLACAKKRGIRSADLAAFLKKLPPAKIIKEELGISSLKGPDDGSSPPPPVNRKPRPRTKPRRRVPHRLAGSASDKIRKAVARASKRVPPPDTEE